MPLIFNTEAFAKVPENLVDSNKPNIKKYNVRVHKTDLVILDALAARSGISRSQLLNQLVEKILLNTLCTLDTRAAYYVANVANKLAGISPKEGWVLDLASQKYSVVHELEELCRYENACSEEHTDRDQIHEKISQAHKDGKLGKI
ncbi:MULTISPECIES: hypothetical protein [Acinetobacter]|jgi:hypothetical protein|uniref:Uncharacterized protein n=1 Tax=Acinetobacter lwoffii NIPH 478 TaxID=1217668 RepID=N9HEY6_ACILW|nr:MULTISPECIES: hypothetical protein [Acinetobacter]ENW27809.1 hypothetical protein F923_03076 [Acinetobacter lwoffii NIPH 478]